MPKLFSKYIILILLSFPSLCKGQTPNFDKENENTDLKDSLDFLKIKKACHIVEYRDKEAAYYFSIRGEFIKAYTFSSSDNMIRLSIAESTVETIWVLDLQAYGNIWVRNPIGVEAIGGIGEESILIPDFPIKVEYDKEKKLYLYSVHLVSKQPFQTVEDQNISKDIFYILTSSVYRLDVFEHKVKNTDFMTNCFNKIVDQMLSKEDKKELKERERKSDNEFAPILKQAEEMDKQRKKNLQPNKVNKTK